MALPPFPPSQGPSPQSANENSKKDIGGGRRGLHPGQIGNFWLTQRPGSPYWYRTWYDKKNHTRRRKSLGETDFQKAQRALMRYVLEKDRPQNAAPESVYLAAVLLGYFDAHGRNLPSSANIKLAMSRFNEIWPAYLVSQITVAEQNRYIEKRRSEKVSDATIDRELTILRAALRHSLKLGELTHVPFIKSVETAIDKRGAPPRGRPLSMAEMAALFNAAKTPRTRLFLLLLSNTMCRPGAAFDLTKAQIDLEQGLVTLNPEDRKQTKKYRPVVPLTRTLRVWVENWPTDRFMAYGSQRVTTAKNLWRRLREASGLKGRVNGTGIRHTMARELRKRRVPSEQIELMLGHRLPGATTQIYAPYDPDYCRDAIAAIDAYMTELQKLVTAPIIGPGIVVAENRREKRHEAARRQ